MTKLTSPPRVEELVSRLRHVVDPTAIRTVADFLDLVDYTHDVHGDSIDGTHGANGANYTHAAVPDAVPGTSPRSVDPVVVAAPASESEISHLLRLADESGWKVAPVGANTQRGFGGVMEPVALAVESLHLNHLVDYSPADMVVTVQAGMPFRQLKRVLAEHGQMLPLDPLSHPDATIGGIVATGISGPLRTMYGTLRDMVIGLRTVYPSGQIVRTGGKVVKNVAGYDMSKLFIGSLGTLAFISEITFKVRPLPSHTELCLLVGDRHQVAEAVSRIINSHLIASRMEALYGPWALDALEDASHDGSRISSRDASGDEPPFALAVESHEPRAGSMAQSQALSRLAADLGIECKVLAGDSTTVFWDQYQDAALTNAMCVRYTVPPNRAVAFTHALARLLPTRDALFSVTPVAGIGRVFASGLTPEDEIQMVTIVRGAAGEHGGIAVVESGSRKARQSVDPFGFTGSELQLHRRIKQAIDPHGMLSPNRFLGGM